LQEQGLGFVEQDAPQTAEGRVVWSHRDRAQAAAANKRPGPDAGDTVGDGDAGQPDAVGERISPMPVTLLRMVTLVRLEQERNAPSPTLATGRSLILSGMVTSPPGPVYPVMVMVPLLVVKVNWACATAGIVKSSSGRSHEAQKRRDKRRQKKCDWWDAGVWHAALAPTRGAVLSARCDTKQV